VALHTSIIFRSIKQIGRNLFYLCRSKHGAELAYWQKCYQNEGGTFQNSHYQKLLLGIAGEADDLFLANKRIADFGCGPRGTLSWVKSTETKIGIDVLSTLYLQHFGSAMKAQGMLYVTSTESFIPIPDAYLDVIFTLNAFDHVANPELMASELLRILKPGGEFIGSFNLNEPKTKAEPQTLTEPWLRKHFFAGYQITSWRVSAKPETGYLYQPLLDNALIPAKQEPAILWVRATKER
jgi:SAM-dependent methyltransferase